MRPTVYLLHFVRPLHHARHYLGYTDDLESRLRRHEAGDGAKLIAAVNRAGIPFVLARTWEGDRQLERRLKRRKGAPRLCPICRAEAVKGGA